MTALIERATDILFGCWHTQYTWPQGRGTECHVTCLECGKEFPYDPERMRRVEVKQ